MITFNGASIDSVAPVKIEDVRIGPIEIAPVVRPRAIDAGSEFVRVRGGIRTISVMFAILDDSKINRQAYLQAVTDWATTSEEKPLLVPWNQSRYLQCICTGKPEPSTRQWWESKLRLTFTCFSNPYWTDTAEKTVACGTAFTVGGSAVPLMRITRALNSSASNQAYSDGTNTITFSTIPSGSLEIDLNRQTAAVGGTSIMQYYAVASKWILPKLGAQTITGTGTVRYRERWE